MAFSSQPSLRVRHDLKLNEATVLFFFQIFPALLDVDVIPGENLAHRARALRVPFCVDSQVGESLPPDVRLETLPPAVQSAAAPPCLFERGRGAAVAAGKDAFQQAGF